MRLAARIVKKALIDFYWTIQGPRISVPPIPANPRSVLFVCKGNICRSPFAERLASKLEREGMNSGIRFGSAGLHVPKPISSPENAIQIAKQFGGDLESHRSQSISLELVQSYDMIIAMEVWQYTELQTSFKNHQDKLFLLPLLESNGRARQYGYAAFNIEDPYGGAARAFQECFGRMSSCIMELLERIG